MDAGGLEKTLASPERPSEVLPEGARVGRYVVVAPLGTGAMGVVYRAFDPSLERLVALKLLNLGRVGPGQSSEARARLLSEAQAMARVAHPNVITVHDVGIVERQIFVAMELVKGATLRDWLAQRPRTWREVLRLMGGAGRGLSAAHAAGIVHRDFKPENVLVTADDVAKVGDFGLARAEAHGPPEVAAAPPTPIAEAAQILTTQAGALIGTPAYMAPEQLDGLPADARSDQFSFAVTLYEAVAGSRPWGGASIFELRQAMRSGARQPPRRPLPTGVRRILDRALRIDARERYPTIDALVSELEGVLRTRRLRQGVAAAAVAGLALAAAVSLRARRCDEGAGRIAAVWNAQARSRMTGMDRAAALIDAFSDRWQEVYDETCEAELKGGPQAGAVQALRTACLEDQRAQLAALVEGIAARPADGENAVVLAAALGPVERCGAAELRASRAGLGPPPSVAREVARIRAELEANQVRARLSPSADVVAETRAIAEQARRTGYAPLLAEAWHAVALEEEEEHRWDGALAAYSEAALAAERGADDEERLRIALDRATLRAMRIADFARAAEDLAEAEAVLRRLGSPPIAEADFEYARGLFEWQRGHSNAAVAALQRSAELRRSVLGASHPLLGRALGTLGQALKRAGRFSEAEAVSRQALDLISAAMGPRHPLTLGRTIGLASTQLRLGKAAEAARTFESARADDGPGVARKSDQLVVDLHTAEAWAAAGEAGRARRLFDTAAPWLRSQLVGDDLTQAAIHFTEGKVLEAEGRSAEAAQAFEAALARSERVRGSSSALLIDTLIALSRTRQALHRTPAALATAERAARLSEQLEEGDPIRIEAQAHFGAVLADSGDRSRALPLLEGAWAWQRDHEPEPVRRGETAVAIARLIATEDPARAKDLRQAGSAPSK